MDLRAGAYKIRNP